MNEHVNAHLEVQLKSLFEQNLKMSSEGFGRKVEMKLFADL